MQVGNTENEITHTYSFFSVPPGRPIIYNERGIIVENNLGPYNEGVELILTCSVSGGKSDYIFYNFSFEREKKKSLFFYVHVKPLTSIWRNVVA